MIRLTVTLPEDIYKQVKERAKQQYRSISNQIVYEITNYFSTPPMPGYPFTSVPGPGIPEEPYRITLTSNIAQPGPDLAPAPEPKYEPVAKERLQPYKNTKHSIEDYEQHITDIDNKYYKKIKQYCINSCEEKEFLDILAHPDAAYIKKNYKSIIYAALEIPGTHDLSNAEWDEIAGYFR